MFSLRENKKVKDLNYKGFTVILIFDDSSIPIDPAGSGGVILP